MTASALDLSAEHLRQVAELYEAARTARVEADAESLDPVALSREHVRRTKRLLLDVQKMRRSPRTRRVHDDSHARRLALEEEWTARLRLLSEHLVGGFDVDAAITAAQRAWIVPPDEPSEGVLVDGEQTNKSRWLAKARRPWQEGNSASRPRKAPPEPAWPEPVTPKAKVVLTHPRPSDLAAVEQWPGKRGVVARLAMRKAEMSAGFEALVMRDASGNPLAVAAIKRTAGNVHVEFFAAVPGGHNGEKMMRGLAQSAKAEGSGISLFSVPEAEKFYQGIGMGQGERGGQYVMTPAQTAAFAVTGGVLPPAGARAAGLTPTEQMGAQQLALNALAGVPEGKSGGVDDVRRALTSQVNEDAWRVGAETQYLGLSVKTAEQAGQVSLDHLGIDRTFAFATPRTMAQDSFAVRGSKIIDNMYGAHRDALTRIIVDATNPTEPKTIAQVKAAIREQWPRLQSYQVSRIARTETAAVWTATAANAYAANGISQFESIVATGPSIGVESEDPCDECVDAAADVHSMDDDLPPWHPNCRCEAVPVLEDEDGTPWLPPDEPWTGGGADSGAPLTPPEPLPEPPPLASPNQLPPLPPGTKEPSADILLKGQIARDTVNEELGNIGRVHSVPSDVEPPRVKGSTKNTYSADENQINLNPRPDNGGYLQGTSVVHEYGHFVQSQLREVVTVNKQIEVADLAEATPEFATFERYDQYPDELFSRVYQQWIATKNADEVKLAFYRSQGKFWSPESFKPLGAKMDEVFAPLLRETKTFPDGSPKLGDKPLPAPHEIFPKTPEYIGITWNEEKFMGALRPYEGRVVRVTGQGYKGHEYTFEGKLEGTGEKYPTIAGSTIGNGKDVVQIDVLGKDGEWHTTHTKPEEFRPKPEPEAPPPAPKPAPEPPKPDSGRTVTPEERASIRFRAADRALQETTREGLGQIGKVLRLPEEAPPVDLVRGSGAANFSPAQSAAYTGGERGAVIRGFVPARVGADVKDLLWHEYGHYLDWSVFGGRLASPWYATERRVVEMEPLLTALRQSPEIRAWKDIYRSGGGPIATKARARYMMSDEEIFARGFAQYVATATGDEEMLAYIAKRISTENGGWYWTPENFKPIKEEMDKLFEKRGMLVEPKVSAPLEPPPAPEPAPEPPSDVPEGSFAPTTPLTEREQMAVNDYTGRGGEGQEGYLRTNRWLRKLQVNRGVPLERIKARVANLDAAIEKAAPLAQEATVYRAYANTEHMGVPFVGQVVEDKAYLSTSATRRLPSSWAGAHGDVWEIKVPEGTRGIDVNAALKGTPYGPHGLSPATSKETEIILPRDTRLVVDSVTERITVYPQTGQRVVAHDVKAHVELVEPPLPPPPPPPAPEPKPVHPTTPEPTPATTTTNPPLPEWHDFQTPSGLEAGLAHYEGKQVRLTFTFPSGGTRQFSGLVERNSRGRMMVNRATFRDSAVPNLTGVEVKVGGRFKPWREFEQMKPEEQNPGPRTQRTATGAKEQPVPAGGYQFPDNVPSGRIGDVPATPTFENIAHAQAFAEKYLAREVYLGKNPELKGVQEALDAMAQVLRPYDLKIERLQVEHDPRSSGLAYYSSKATKKMLIDGKKQYWSGELIRAQAQLFSKTKAAAVGDNQAVFERNRDRLIQTRQDWIDKAEERHTPPEKVAEYVQEIRNLQAAKRWYIAAENGGADAAAAFMSHEAGHMLSQNFGHAIAGVRDDAEGLARIFTMRLELGGVTQEERWSVSQYGASGDNPRQAANSELFAEVTAAKVTGHYDLVPLKIREAYEETLATITPEEIAMKRRYTEARDAEKAYKARHLAVRKRVGLQ